MDRRCFEPNSKDCQTHNPEGDHQDGRSDRGYGNLSGLELHHHPNDGCSGAPWCAGDRSVAGRDRAAAGPNRQSNEQAELAVLEELERLAEKVDADLAAVCAAMGTIQEPENQEAVALCFWLITAADGALQAAEQAVLARLLQALGQEHLLGELPALAKRFRREDGAIDQALFAVGDAANLAGAKVGEAIGWAGKRFGGDKPADADGAQVAFEASAPGFSKVVTPFVRKPRGLRT